MRIIPFPEHDEQTAARERWASELEAALDGTGQGPRAETWRQLREQVRSAAPTMTPEFEHRLSAQLAGLRAPAASPRRRRPARLWRPRNLGVAAPVVVGAIVALLLTSGSPGPAPQMISAPHGAPAIASAGAQRRARKEPAQAAAGQGSASAGASAVQAEPTAPTSPARIQQLAASITLAPAPAEVQETADRVSRMSANYGGFVQSSRVDVAPGGGEANLTLSLPSAELGRALVALADLAPVRAESQSLEDITGAYDAARQRLAQASAEERALLRALARASTAGQIDSLRERLAQARGAIARARSSVRAVSLKAARAEVEVSVLANPHATGDGLTLEGGLHDAARVLTVTLVVLLVGATALVPLALLVLALFSARGSWRRYQRERALTDV